MSNIYKFKKSLLTGGKDKDLLDGAEIKMSEDEKCFELRIVAARTTGQLPTGAFQFPAFDFADYTWNIAVSTQSSEQMTGTWHNTDPTITDAENGDFTAQAGQGAEDEAKDASAAGA